MPGRQKRDPGRGSITLFFSMLLCVLVLLLCAGYASVRASCERAQCLNGMDIGLFSLFGTYDRELLEKYELFALDASTEGDTDLSGIYRIFRTYMEDVLRQGSRELVFLRGGFSGYRLLTDENGAAFVAQAVDAVKTHAKSRGTPEHDFPELFGKSVEWRAYLEEGKELEETDWFQLYAGIMEEAESRSAQLVQSGESLDDGGRPAEAQHEVILVIPALQAFHSLSAEAFLERVIGLRLSGGKKLYFNPVSTRARHTGLPLPRAFVFPDMEEDWYVFRQYLQEKSGCYCRPCGEGLLWEQEYLLNGCLSDAENLKRTMKTLLLLLEGMNHRILAGSGSARERAAEIAEKITLQYAVPPDQAVLEEILLYCWAYAESIADLRCLAGGGRLSGELSFSSVITDPEALKGLLSSGGEGAEDGYAYEDFLQALLFSAEKQTLVFRGLDLVEMTMRAGKNRSFRADSCLVAAALTAYVRTGRRRTLQITRTYGYPVSVWQ